VYRNPLISLQGGGQMTNIPLSSSYRGGSGSFLQEMSQQIPTHE
jgi:hypothetical protein